MEVMKIEKAEKLGLMKPSYSEKLHPMPSNIWRPTLTKEQEEQQKKDIESGAIPF